MLQVYRYRFAPGVDLQEAEDTLLLAMLAAEGLLGEARVRMDAAYTVDESIRAIVVDASTVVGQIISTIFTTLVLREFGRQAVDVRKFEGLTRKEGGR